MNEKPKQHKITVDIPEDVWEAMRTLAQQHQRSFVKELIWALHDYIRREQKRATR
jgi:hypothetical protein